MDGRSRSSLATQKVQSQPGIKGSLSQLKKKKRIIDIIILDWGRIFTPSLPIIVLCQLRLVSVLRLHTHIYRLLSVLRWQDIIVEDTMAGV